LLLKVNVLPTSETVKYEVDVSMRKVPDNMIGSKNVDPKLCEKLVPIRYQVNCSPSSSPVVSKKEEQSFHYASPRC